MCCPSSVLPFPRRRQIRASPSAPVSSTPTISAIYQHMQQPIQRAKPSACAVPPLSRVQSTIAWPACMEIAAAYPLTNICALHLPAARPAPPPGPQLDLPPPLLPPLQLDLPPPLLPSLQPAQHPDLHQAPPSLPLPRVPSLMPAWALAKLSSVAA
ncbi:hypothetical protein DFP73DRAFT_538497 [Morchella snyderi]|nr:hypothetical protein DFP73DRAFT_538497 [Morchella snyderi]